MTKASGKTNVMWWSRDGDGGDVVVWFVQCGHCSRVPLFFLEQADSIYFEQDRILPAMPTKAPLH